MDFIGNLFGNLAENQLIIAVIIMVVAWLGRQVISWLFVKWPVLRRLKLMERWEKIIDKVKEDKLEAASKKKKLSRHEIHTLVDHYSKAEKVNPTDVILHRRRLKRSSVGLSVGYDRNSGPNVGVNLTHKF